MREKNCYVNGVPCRHLLPYAPYCHLNPKRSERSQPTFSANNDSGVCGDYSPDIC